MGIKYFEAPDIEEIAKEMVALLGWRHIHLEDVAFVRSFGSTARYTIARCHSLGRAMQVGMKRKRGFYLIEVISEKFDKLPDDEKKKVILHELMHIPKSFGGGFVHHNKVHDKAIDKIYQRYLKIKDNKWF
ncbi:metallopeptidase [Candidatus Pacearchaeota archaeon]|nr:MAG: metallopeptidase [Candidatus Pacearchaeota archaeon]